MIWVEIFKLYLVFDMDELGFFNDYDVLEASRNFNDNSLESERFGRGNAGTNNVHDEDGDKYVDEKEEDDDDYIPSNEEGFEFVNK